MGLCFQLFICVILLRGVESAGQIPWLRCNFTDEEVTLTTQGPDTKHIHRRAVLQFGLKGDPPVQPGTVTFLITPSKLDVRRSLAGAEVAELTCSLMRYSTDGSHVRWPVRGEHEYNRWFTLHLGPSKKQFDILAFLRQSTEQPPTGQHDYKSWPLIRDNDVLTTSVVMVLQTQTPVVRSPLKSQPKLHCQFDIDHKAAKVTVKWHKDGDRTVLFNYDSQTGLTEGSGVELKQLAAGDATYTYPVTKVGSEGTYLCSVNVHPLLWSLRVDLEVEEPPRVSLNVEPSLTLTEGTLRRVECWADRFYPQDVHIQWSHQGRTDVGPRVDSAQLSSHFHNPDQTLNQFAFFNLRPHLGDSGRRFTCSVSHRTLSAPITKTFTLTVTEPGREILAFQVFLLLVVLVLMLGYCLRVRKRRLF